MSKQSNIITNPWESACYIVDLAKTKPLHLACLVLTFIFICYAGFRLADWTYNNAIEHLLLPAQQ